MSKNKITSIKNKEFPAEKIKSDNFLWHIIELIAVGIWIFIITKLLIFDIDRFIIIKFFPNYLWLLKFKIIFITGIISLIWFFTRSKHFFLWLLFIVFYPLVLFLIRIPFFIFKQKSWILGIAFVNGLIEFLRSIKHNFIISTLLLTSAIFLISLSNIPILWVSIVITFLILIITYIKKFLSIFKPSNIFQIHAKLISKLREFSSKTLVLDEETKTQALAKLTEKQLTTRNTNLQSAILFNRACLFFSKKIKEYQKSRINYIFYTFNFISLMVLTVFSFACINFGLYKINVQFFIVPAKVTFFNFFFYSFNTLFFNDTQFVMPNNFFTQTAFMLEQSFAFFLGSIFISLLWSVKNDKYIDEVNKGIEEIKNQGLLMEAFIKDEFKLSVTEAIEELNRAKFGAVNLIYQLSKYIEGK